MKKLLFCLLLCVGLVSVCCGQDWEKTFKKGIDFYNKKDFENAVIYFEKSLNLAEKEFGKEHIDYVSNCILLGGLYSNKNMYSKAERILIEAKCIQEKILKKESKQYINICSILANVYSKQKIYDKAEFLYNEVKDIKEKLFGKKHIDYIEYCNNLCDFYNNIGRYNKLENLYIELKDIQEDLFGKNSINYAISCNNLGSMYYKISKYKKAKDLCIESKNIYEKIEGNESKNYANSCNLLSLIYQEQDKLDSSFYFCIKAKDIKEKILGKEHYDYAISCNNLSELYRIKGNYIKAEKLCIEAKDIYEKKLNKENLNYATFCNNLGVLYVIQGKYKEGEELIVTAKNIRQKILSNIHPDYIISCNNIAELYKRQDKYEYAEKLFIEIIEIYEKYIQKKDNYYTIIANNLASLYTNQKKYYKAKMLYIEAKNIRAKILGKEHYDYASSCNNLAHLYLLMGRYKKSEKLLLETQKIYEKVLDKNNIDYAIFCNNFGYLYKCQNKYEQAEFLFIKGNQILLSHINNNFANLSEKEKENYYNTFNSNFKMFNIFSLERYNENQTITKEVYNNTLVTKGLLFSSFNTVRERIMSSGNEEVKTLYNAWKDKRSYIANVASRTITEREREGIDLPTLETEANELEKQLSLKSEDFKRANDKTRYTWQDVQKGLKEGEVAVELIRFRVFDKEWIDSVKYMALVVLPTAPKQPLMVALHHGNWLEKEGAELYRKHYQSAESVGKENVLYQKLWQPIAQVLPAGTEKVYLSADGVYHQINLETLYNPTTQGYLGDNLTIQVVGSTKDILKRLPAKGLPTSLVLFGFPDYQTQTQEGENEANNEVLGDVVQKDIQKVLSEKITGLEGTKKEVEDIARLAQSYNLKTEVYLQKQASEGAVKKLRSPSVLHIATHGFYASPEKLEGVERKTPRIMTRELAMPQDENRAFDVPVENPLLRAGLLLAGAEKTLYQDSLGQGLWQKEDGILTAQEALSLYLDDTDLVVLSACETGLGYISNGEGVYGLQRSFQQAGAKAVIMSLWKVSDEVTQKLMTVFYTNWLQKKMPKREAFRDAQKQIRKEHPLPFYWGAFVMVGE